MKPKLLLPIVVAVLALGLSACGSSSKSSSASGSTTSTSNNPQAQFQAYTACLKQNGVANVPTVPARGQGAGNSGNTNGSTPPTTDANGNGDTGRRQGGGFGGGAGGFNSTTPPSGVDQATWDKARAACQSKLPTFGNGNGGGNSQAFQAYQSCLKDHGVDTAAPGTGSTSTTIDRNSDTYKAAETACAALRPMPNNSSTSTTVGGSAS